MTAAAKDKKKVVLITGCSEGGIGSALALEFHARGHVVIATARRASKMAHLVERGVAHALEMDVTSEASIAAAVAAVRERTSQDASQDTSRDCGGGGGARLDLLINNAGVNHVMPFADATVADFRRVMETNVVGAVAVTRAFLPLLVAARGLVAAVGSVNPILHPPFQLGYVASKAALASVCDVLRVELAPLGVRVVLVVTGSVRSRLFDNADVVEPAGGAGPARLPEGSWYAPIRDKIEGRAFLEGVKWTPAEEYARKVAGDLLRERPSPVLYRGSLSSIARWLSVFTWKGSLDAPLQRFTGLSLLRPPAPAPVPDNGSRPHQD